DGQIRNMAIALPGEEIHRALQVDEPGPLAVGVFGHEQIAVGRLVLQVPRQVAPDSADAFIPAAPRRQREIHEAERLPKDEIAVFLFGQADQQAGVGHGVIKQRGGCGFYTLPALRDSHESYGYMLERLLSKLIQSGDFSMSTTRRLHIKPEADAPFSRGLGDIQRALNLPSAFPPEVEAAAAAAATHPRWPALDRSEIALVTIDPAGAMDLDQAMYVERTDGGYRVYYAIADV